TTVPHAALSLFSRNTPGSAGACTRLSRVPPPVAIVVWSQVILVLVSPCAHSPEMSKYRLTWCARRSTGRARAETSDRGIAWPRQNVGHTPGRASAASHVFRYGERTASGTAGGRTGSKVAPVAGPAAAADCPRAGSAAAATAPATPAAPVSARTVRRETPDSR